MFVKARASWLLNPSRVHIREYNSEFAKGVTHEMTVLDAGAGRAPYRALFSHARYESADFAELKAKYRRRLTYVCDLTNIPVEDGHFDRVVFNQVLEHLPEPLRVLRELARIMKDDGQIICTCPLFYEEHQKPYDFYRYTQFAHRYLFEAAGFEIEQLEWVEGYFATVAHQFRQMYKYLPTNVSRLENGWRWLYLAPLLHGVRLSGFVLCGIFARLDLRWKYTDRGFPKNYVIIARKRPSLG